MDSLRIFMDATLAEIPTEEQVSASSTEELSAQLEQLKASYLLFILVVLLVFNGLQQFLHALGALAYNHSKCIKRNLF